MNAEQILQRIFSLARRAPEEQIPEAPFGWETAILGHWRETLGQRAAGAGLLRGLGWAAIMSCAIAMLAGVLASDELSVLGNRDEPEARVAETAIVAGFDYE